MIRFICRETNSGAACNVGGPVDIKWVTFTDPTKLEPWLRFEDAPEPWQRNYVSREHIGTELCATPPQTEGPNDV